MVLPKTGKKLINFRLIPTNMLNKRDFIEKSMFQILNNSNDWVEIKELTYMISSKNRSYRITKHAVAKIATNSQDIEKIQKNTTSTTITLYRLLAEKKDLLRKSPPKGGNLV